MKIAIRVLLLLGALLAGSGGWTSPHEIHVMQKDMAVLQAQQQQAIEKAALAQRLELKTALESVDKRLDQLSTRLDELDKRIGDVSLYLTVFGIVVALFGILFTVLAVLIGYLTYINGVSKANETAIAWMKANGAREIKEAAKPLWDSYETELDRRHDEAIGELTERVDKLVDQKFEKLKKKPIEPMGSPGAATPALAPASAAAAAPPSGPVTAEPGAPSLPQATVFDGTLAGATAAIDAGRFAAALDAATHALELARTDLQRLQAGRARGRALYNLERWGEALEEFEKGAIGLEPGAGDAATEEIARSHYGKALTLYALNRDLEAESTLEALVRQFLQAKPGPKFDVVVAMSLSALAYHCQRLGRNTLAIDAARRLSELYAGDPRIEIRRLLAEAQLPRALALGATEGWEAERQAYAELRQQFQAETDEEIRTAVAYALFNTGLLYEQQNQIEAAREVYLQIEREYQGESLPALVTTVRDARQRLRALGSPPERPAAPPSER